MILRMSFRCDSDAAPKLIFAASSARRWASSSISAVFVVYSLSSFLSSRIFASTSIWCIFTVALYQADQATKYCMLPRRPKILAMTLRLWSSRRPSSFALSRSRSSADSSASRQSSAIHWS